jgi:hypothetical protein
MKNHVPSNSHIRPLKRMRLHRETIRLLESRELHTIIGARPSGKTTDVNGDPPCLPP